MPAHPLPRGARFHSRHRSRPPRDGEARVGFGDTTRRGRQGDSRSLGAPSGGLSALVKRNRGRDDSTDRENGDGDEQPPAPSVGALLLSRLARGGFLFGFVQPAARLQEGEFGRGEVRLGLVLPFEGFGESGAAVELAVGAVHGVPGVGGDDEVAQDALAFGVVVEPVVQAWPGPDQGFVGEFDDAVVAGDQPGCDQGFDECSWWGVSATSRRGSRLRIGSPSGLGATMRSSRSRRAGRWSRRHCFVDGLGGLGDGAADSAGLAVAGDGEGVASRPSQVARSAWESSGRAPGSPSTSRTSRSTRPGFEPQAGAAGGSLDRVAQVSGGHRVEQVQAAFDQAGEPGVGRRGHRAGPRGRRRSAVRVRRAR